MSNLNYTNWWRNGTIGVTKNSNEITGASTYWSTTNINPGDIFIDNSGIYEVQSVTDDTHLTLATPYLGETGSGLAYAIIRNFTSTTNAKVAAMTSELMYEFARFIDNERSTITGKSAYEIWQEAGNTGTVADYLESLKAKNDYQLAVDNGYTGTQAEWLESLKAAGEWSSANTRLTSLEQRLACYPQPGDSFTTQLYHNLHPRFKNLGTIVTAAQYNAINNITFNDLYIGDYWEWTINNRKVCAHIVQLGETGTREEKNKCVHLWIAYPNTEKNVMNDEATTEGGYLASKMHTQTMPALAAELEEFLGAGHLREFSQYVCSSNQYDAKGQLPLTQITSKLELFQANDIFPIINYNGLNDRDMLSTSPYALFQQIPGQLLYNNIKMYPHCWLQEPSKNNPTSAFLALNGGSSLMSISANSQNIFTVAHAVLIP